MSRNILIGIVLVIAVVAGAAWWVMMQNSNTSDTSLTTETPTQQNTTTPPTDSAPQATQTKILHDAELSASPTTGTIPLGVSFSANKQGLIDHNTNYTVDFGDGTKTTTDDFTCGLQFCSKQHSYTSPGTYTAKYTDASGIIVKSVTIVVSPVAVPSGYKAVINSQLNLSFDIPQTWIATTSSDGGANYWSPDVAFGCYDPSDATAEPCQLRGSTLGISVKDIAASIQSPAEFLKFYKDDVYGGMSNESIDTSLAIPAADAVIIAQSNSPYKQTERNGSGPIPDEYYVTAHLLRNSRDYELTVETTTSPADARSILITVLQSMR